MATKILWSGLTGRVGQEAARIAVGRSDLAIVAGIKRRATGADDVTLGGIASPVWYQFCNLIKIATDEFCDFDVIVDFSHADAFNNVLRLAIRTGKPLVIGTTGLSNRQLATLYDATSRIPIFRDDNMRFVVKRFIDEATALAKQGKTGDLHENFYRGRKILPSQESNILRARIREETGRTIEVKSAATLNSDGRAWEWKYCGMKMQISGLDDLAHDALEIAKFMATQPVQNGKFYTLEQIWPSLADG